MTQPERAEAALERLRWSVEEFTFPTPEVYEARRGEPWHAPGTRNHQSESGKGISREIRSDEDDLGVTEHGHREALAVLVTGRTIIGVAIEPDSDEDWPQGENSVSLTLDDGGKLTFGSWGHDAWGVVTRYTVPPNASGDESPP